MDAGAIAVRLRQLQAEFEKGRRELGQLEIRRSDLERTLLRIEGAIEVLREFQLAGHDAAGGVKEAV